MHVEKKSVNPKDTPYLQPMARKAENLVSIALDEALKLSTQGQSPDDQRKS